jgi:hypothetical protein
MSPGKRVCFRLVDGPGEPKPWRLRIDTSDAAAEGKAALLIWPFGVSCELLTVESGLCLKSVWWWQIRT